MSLVHKKRYWVVCPDYASGPYRTERDARDTMEWIARGSACRHEHRIVISPRNNLTAREAWDLESISDG